MALGDGFAVIDVETTGFSYGDRIIEIGVVLLDDHAQLQSEWSTLVQPHRDIPNSFVHGITSTDLRAAPDFPQISVELAHQLEGRLLVAHNAAFDQRFLQSELQQAGVIGDLSHSFLCTRRLSSTLLPGKPQKLSDCLETVGVKNDAEHAALGDARATAQLFGVLRQQLGKIPQNLSTVHLDVSGLPEEFVPTVNRSFAGAETATWLSRISSTVPSTGSQGRDSYRQLLHQALADGELSKSEIDALVGRAKPSE